MMDGRRAGELDLADLIQVGLVDQISEEAVAAIPEAVWQKWEHEVRDMLETRGINRYYDRGGQERKQEVTP